MEETIRLSPDKIVRLVSVEGESFEVPINVVSLSALVGSIVDADGDEVQELPLPNVRAAILGKVVEFCSHYAIEPMTALEKPLKAPSLSDLVQDWYINFLGTDLDIIFELILAANYMDLQPLLDLACGAVASMVKSKTPQEIREFLDVENDLTPEEEAEICEAHQWVSEE